MKPDRRYRYSAYGMAILADAPLALPEGPRPALGEIECLSAPPAFFEQALDGARFRPDGWYAYALLPDGSSYVRWADVGEFLVRSDGRQIRCRPHADASSESFQVYLLGQAFSFALIKQRLEPLHATAVLVDDGAIAFLGGNGFGKSSLAAQFLAEGARLVTDDLLVPTSTAGAVVVHPGSPRIKLFAKTATSVFCEAGSGMPMNTGTSKLIVSLAAAQGCTEPVALRAIYVLDTPRDCCRLGRVDIAELSPREAFVALVGSTFNRRVAGAERLANQFTAMTAIAGRIPVKRLAYPRVLERLRDVSAAVKADVQDP